MNENPKKGIILDEEKLNSFIQRMGESMSDKPKTIYSLVSELRSCIIGNWTEKETETETLLDDEKGNTSEGEV